MSKLRETAKKLLGKGGAVWLVILAGVLLLLLPGRKEMPVQEETADPCVLPDAAELERELSALLSQVDGAGRVEVLLAPAAGQSRVLAENRQSRAQGDASETETETVVLSSDDGGEEPVTLQLFAEQYRGAVIVAEGGGDPSVALALTRAVSAATGLGADKITVMKMMES